MLRKTAIGLALAVFLAATLVTISGFGTKTRAASSDAINKMLSVLPVLPPDKAKKKINPALTLSGLPVEKFLILLSQKAFLDMNLVIATSDKSILGNTVELYLSDITLGEAFNLVLQLNDLKAVRFNENTLIITKAADKKEFGVKRQKIFFLTYTSPKKVMGM